MGAEAKKRGSRGHHGRHWAGIPLFPEKDGPGSLDILPVPHGTPILSWNHLHSLVLPAPLLPLPSGRDIHQAAAHPMALALYTYADFPIRWGGGSWKPCHLLPSGSPMGRSAPGPCFATYFWQIHLCIVVSPYLSLNWGHRCSPIRKNSRYEETRVQVQPLLSLLFDPFYTAKPEAVLWALPGDKTSCQKAEVRAGTASPQLTCPTHTEMD